MERVTQLLGENKQKLINLAEALIQHEVLEKDEILKAMEGELLTDTRKSRSYLKGSPERRQRDAAVAAAAEAVDGDFKPAEKSDGPAPDGEDDKGKGGRFDAQA
jgi:cell division protease FtsH